MAKEKRKTGLVDGKFHPCPRRKVCVSTMSPEKWVISYIKPISYTGTKQKAMDKILKIIISMKRTKLLEKADNYMHFVFTTALFRFKDDVEFLFDDTTKTIHFRSQSRIGGYDWNVNRNRMESIRRLYQEEK